MSPWFILAGFGLFYGFGASEVRRFENIAAEEIRSKLRGEAAVVRVRTKLNGLIGGPLGDLLEVKIAASQFQIDELPLFTEPHLSKKGIIRELKLELNDFSLGGLRIEHLRASIPDCRFDYSLAVRKRMIRLSRSGVGQGSVTILERDLENFILKKYREIKTVKVRVAGGKVFVDGYGEFLIIKTNFSVIANLLPENGSRLVLADARIFFDERRADEGSAKALLDTLNPVVDLDRDLRLFGAIFVRELKLHDGRIFASGDTQIPVRPKSELRFLTARRSASY